MEIILKEDIIGLGFKNDIVTVKNGYGRNYLIPTGKGVIASESAKKQLAETLKQQARKLAAIKAEAEKKGEAIKDVALVIPVKVSANGVAYGAVTANTVAAELQKLGFDIDRKIVTMHEAKKVGDYVATVHFHKEVLVEVPVKVVAEGAEKVEEAPKATEEAPVEAPAEEAKAEDKVEFQAVNAKTRGPLVENGEVDCVIATFTITPERKETYNFSPAYYTDAVGLLVLKDSGIKDVEDLDGKIIGVAQSSTSQAEFEKYKEENGVKATPTFQEFATYPELAQALAAKQIDVFSVDGAILAGYVNDTNELLDVRYGEQEYGICSNKENEELSELINTTVQEMLDDGSMDALLEKWGL